MKDFFNELLEFFFGQALNELLKKLFEIQSQALDFLWPVLAILLGLWLVWLLAHPDKFRSAVTVLFAGLVVIVGCVALFFAFYLIGLAIQHMANGSRREFSFLGLLALLFASLFGVIVLPALSERLNKWRFSRASGVAALGGCLSMLMALGIVVIILGRLLF